MKNTAVSGAKSEEGLDFLVQESKSEVKATVDSLASIPARKLNSRCTKEVMQDDTMNFSI